MSYFSNLFAYRATTQDTSIVEQVIRELVDKNMDSLITAIPYFEEITRVMFSRSKEGSHKPYGFVGFFYQTY